MFFPDPRRPGSPHSPFVTWIERLTQDELEHRRASLLSGNSYLIHLDKIGRWGVGEWLREQGLATPRPRQWIAVERATAHELMATIAVSLCVEATDDDRAAGSPDARWIPTTDSPEAMSGLLAGLDWDGTCDSAEMAFRVEG